MTQTILHCDFPEYHDLPEKLMTVSQGLANEAAEEAFFDALDTDPDTIQIKRHKDTFELWQDQTLIGLCNWSTTFQNAKEYYEESELSDEDEKEKIEKNATTLFVRTYLHEVILLPAYRGQGYGGFFAGILREHFNTQLFSRLMFAERAFDHVDYYSDAEYYSEGGENFHLAIHVDFKRYLSSVLKHRFKTTFEFMVDGGY